MHANAEKIQSEQLARVSASFLRLRPKLLAAVGPVLLGLMWWADVPRHELLAIGLTFLCMLSWFCFEAWAVRKTQLSHDAFCGSLLLTLAGLSMLCTFSGGPRSPFLPILFAPLGIAFAAFGKDRRTNLVFAVFVSSLGYLIVSAALWSWALPERVASIVVVLAALLSSALLYFGITGLATAYRETASSLESARAEVVQSTQDQTRSLQNLSSRVAHELKNPLASIKGLVQLVAEGAQVTTDERSSARLSVVLQEVSRMEQILREYLNFTRPLGDVAATQTPLQPFLLELLRLLEGEAHASDVTLLLDCPQLELPFDANRLRQALLNLSQNALAAMPRGGQLQLSARSIDAGIEIELADTGNGMSTEVLARVKEPYFSQRPGGTGLGVVIADGIVRQHGGTLSFQSSPNTGTRAIVFLPGTNQTRRLP